MNTNANTNIHTTANTNANTDADSNNDVISMNTPADTDTHGLN